MLIVMGLYFILLVLKQVNVVVAVTIPMIHMQKMCVPGVVKNLEVEVFNLMWKTNDKYKELIDKIVCNRGYIWNPINCECECDKPCDIGEYLDHKNCKR